MSQHGAPFEKGNITGADTCGLGMHKTDSGEVEVDDDFFKEASKEILFGSIAGMVSEVFEYPFDLAKVRVQAQLLSPGGGAGDAPKFRGPVHCLLQTWKDEGTRGLYRGIGAPLAGNMAVTAALFLSYASFQNVIRKSQFDPSSPLTMGQLGIAAAGAGAVASFVLTPIELIKCKMQVQMMNLARPKATVSPAVPGRIPHRSPLPQTTPAAAYASAAKNIPGTRSYLHNVAKAAIGVAQPRVAPPGAIPLIRSIVATHGLQGLWLGHTGTVFRETGGSAGWFIVKEYVARALMERRLGVPLSSIANKRDKMPLAWESAVSGAMAGAVGALALYPADTVKSAIQTEEEMRAGYGKRQPADTKRIGRAVVRQGFWRTFMKMYRMHGVKGLYAGCGITVARAIPSSGIIFVVYDGLNNYFGDY